MGRLGFKKGFNRVAPAMLKTKASEPTTALTPDELEAKYMTQENEILDISILPHPKTPEFIALSKMKSFQIRFTDTVIKSLNALEDSLTEMRDECAASLMAFLPKTIPDLNEKDKVHPMTEMESLFFLMLETIRLVDEPLAQDQATFIRQCVAELTTLQSNVHALEIQVNSHRKELKNHYRRLRNLYEACKSEYPKALDPAAELYSEYYINTEDALDSAAPLFLGSSGIPGFSVKPTHCMKFRCQPNGYAVYTRYPDSDPNWKDGITFKSNTQMVMLGGIISEFRVRVDFATAALKTCLSRILRASQNLTQEHKTGVRLETDKLYRLWDYRQLGINQGQQTTMLLFFMRVDRSLDRLNTTLYNLAQALMVLRNRLKYLIKNCASWRLMQKKIIYGPVARNAEKLNYMKLEIPLSTQWTEECVRDFLFEIEPISIEDKVSEEVIEAPTETGDGVCDIWKDFESKAVNEEAGSTAGGGGDTSSNESFGDDSGSDLETDKLENTLNWVQITTEYASKQKPTENSN